MLNDNILDILGEIKYITKNTNFTCFYFAKCGY